MKVNLKKHLFSKKNFKPLIVAEISANHCGSKRIFLKTIKDPLEHYLKQHQILSWDILTI